MNHLHPNCATRTRYREDWVILLAKHRHDPRPEAKELCRCIWYQLSRQHDFDVSITMTRGAIAFVDAWS